ncbi:Spo11/DNA topoisomerase VI [Trypanosoma melophagium]|uniref:Spo11/DNA topoisomerase VI n=1 Tax=Trypanosoma melophagium TaxID=715481 RepID=UPI00351A3D54|nr:Spo11/DNA topoisomerase VI [Trypanosoma melophagium]
MAAAAFPFNAPRGSIKSTTSTSTTTVAAAMNIDSTIDESTPTRHKIVQSLANPVDATFISPDIVAANTPDALRAEAIRRMESFVLRTIHEIVVASQQQQHEDNNTEKLSSFHHAKRSRTSDMKVDHQDGIISETLSSSPVVLRESRLRVIQQQLLVLRVLYNNLHLGVISTQRDLYYRLARLVPDQGCVNRTIQQLVQLLHTPRQWIGVVAGTRGCIGGCLNYNGVDLRTYGSEGLPLPIHQEELRVSPYSMDTHMMESDTVGIHNYNDGFEIHEGTRYIIVIEKHAIFFRLMEEEIFKRVPCVLLTSHGFPTVAARTLLANIHSAAPHIPVVALVDYNPSGISILQQYKHGTGNTQESQYIAVHDLRWLGLRSSHILQKWNHNTTTNTSNSNNTTSLHPSSRIPFQRFTHRDSVMLTNLLTRWRSASESEDENNRKVSVSQLWYDEAVKMQRLQIKVELEALYDHSPDTVVEEEEGRISSIRTVSDNYSFASWVCRALLRQDYI